jgi:hypothetical protein
MKKTIWCYPQTKKTKGYPHLINATFKNNTMQQYMTHSKQMNTDAITLPANNR